MKVLGSYLQEVFWRKNFKVMLIIVYENWMQKEEQNRIVVEYILELNEYLKNVKTSLNENVKKKRKIWHDKNVFARKNLKRMT